MTNILKYDNRSIQGLNDLERIAKQIKDRRQDGLVVVTTALGDTTDRIAEVLYFGNHRNAEQTFEIYSVLADQIGDTQLTNVIRSNYNQFNALRGNARESKNIYEMLLATGEELTSHVVQAYLRQSGVNSSILSIHDHNFPLKLREGRKSTTIDMESSREAAQSLEVTNGILIIPGYAGNTYGLIRTLGRGGSDTAAFVYAYAFGANHVWIVAEDALTTAPLNYAKVVDEIDLDEAWSAGFFGARLRTFRSIEPLKKFFEVYPDSQVFITGQDMEERKTRINPQAEKEDVRFIASRYVKRYGISGNWLGLVNQLYKNSAVDWDIIGGRTEELGLVIFDRGMELADDMIMKAVKRGEIVLNYTDRVPYIGVVGSGMSGKKGIDKRVKSSLEAVDISRTHDPDVSQPNSKSIGIMVDSEYEQQAVESLHREFFRR